MGITISKYKYDEPNRYTIDKNDIPLENILIQSKEFADKTHEHMCNNIRRILFHVNSEIVKRLDKANTTRMDLSTLVISQEDIEKAIENKVSHDELSKVVELIANKGYDCGMNEERLKGTYNIYIYLMNTYDKYYGSNGNRRES